MNGNLLRRASHRGGHWERVCRQLKERFRKVLGKALLTYIEMITVLTDIEAIVNSRPLTYVGDDIKDGRIITPALLSIGRDVQPVPDELPRKVNISLSERFRYQQRLKQHFWKRWQQEYLPSLTVRQKWNKVLPPLQENDIVLITDDNLSRIKWKIGKVEKLITGRDGLVRTVKIRTSKGLLSRPVQRVHFFEEHCSR